jgi:hypothetical protein
MSTELALALIAVTLFFALAAVSYAIRAWQRAEAVIADALNELDEEDRS